jgi:hypothetical protein
MSLLIILTRKSIYFACSHCFASNIFCNDTTHGGGIGCSFSARQLNTAVEKSLMLTSLSSCVPSPASSRCIQTSSHQSWRAGLSALFIDHILYRHRPLRANTTSLKIVSRSIVPMAAVHVIVDTLRGPNSMATYSNELHTQTALKASPYQLQARSK